MKTNLFRILFLFCSFTLVSFQLVAQFMSFNGSTITVPGGAPSSCVLAGSQKVNSAAVSGNCCTFTTGSFQNGAIWVCSPINLNNGFKITFNMNFGTNTASGDGMAFLLQAEGVPQVIGGRAGGIGYAQGDGSSCQGAAGGCPITPSVAVEFDTWDNSATAGINDIACNHMSIQKNGDMAAANSLLNPVCLKSGGTSVVDGASHPVCITWDPAVNKYTVYFDNVQIGVYNGNIRTVFSDPTIVYWGFTGSSGGGAQTQTICNVVMLDPVTSPSCSCTTPVATATPSSQTICSGTATSIALSSSLSGTTYSWTVTQSGVSGASSGSGSTIAQTLTATGASAGTATYTITPTSGGCAGTPITVIITVSPAPTMTSASNATICSGGTVSIPLTSSVASTYTWIASNNANATGESTTTQTTSTLNNTITNTSTSVQTVTYTVTPTSTSGSCPGVPQTVTVTVNPVPVMTSANTATICSGGTVSIPLTSNVASTYTWIAANNANTTGESTTTQTTSTLSNTIVNTSATVQTVTYTVTPTSTAGSCPGTPQTVTVTVNPSPTLTSANTATICSGATVSIPLTSSIASTYTWIATNNANTTGESTTTQTTNTLSNTITNTSAVTQTVTYTVTPTSTVGGCVGTPQTVTVMVEPSPTMTSASTATICSGGTVSIPLTSNIAATYTWIATNNANTTGESTTTQTTSTLSNTITNTSTVTQTVTYTVTPTSTVGGCLGNPQTVTVTVNPVPTMTSANAATICSGGTVSIPLTSNIAATYTWIAGDNVNTTGESTTTQSTSTLSNTITNTSTTLQTVTYTVTPTSTSGSCPGTPQTVTVTVNPAPTMTSSNTATICSGATVSIPLTSSIASTYTWIATNNANTTGESTTLQSTSTLSNTIVTTSAVVQTVTYTVTPTSTAGACVGTPQIVTVTVNPLDNAAFTYSSSTFCQTGTDPSATITGLAGGTFSSTAGLILLNISTGLIDLSASTLGTYVITYTTTGPCPTTGTFNITITTAPSAAFSYAGPYCESDANPTPTFGLGASAGTFTAPAGVVFVSASTGQVDLLASTPGTYTVTNTIAAAGGCGSAISTASITIDPSATVSAGIDQTVCASSATVTLAGTVGGSGTNGTWSGGAGTFSPNNTTLNATYTPTAAEITSGGVTLTLTSNDPAGPCPAVLDQMIITISPAATVNAGIDQTSCATAATVTLAGVIGGSANSGTWSGGAGTFTPGSTTLNATYTPTAAEITAGTVTLTLTTNDPAGPCSAATDQMIITINPIAIVNAGIDQTVCSASPATTLAGVVGGIATSGTWSGGTGTFAPSSASLTATYTPSAAEITAGTVTLTLTTNDPAGPCSAVNDQMIITINPPATISAGVDQTVCASSPNVTLAGVIGGSAISGTWSGGAGTFSPGATTLNAVYTPSAAEITAGTVTLTITSNDPAGPCPAVTDQMIITINSPAISNAGADQAVCATSPIVTLGGAIGGTATSGTWSGGAGTFSPNNTTLNATYTPTAAEITSGGVTLTLTSNDPAGPCPAVLDQMTIAIDQSATANAGPDQTVCASSATLTLAGVLGGSAFNGTWTGGSGTFSPNSNTLNATYTPTADEIAAGSVSLTLTTNDPLGPCAAAIDQMTINITPLDNASFSYTSTYCATGADPTATITGLPGGTFSGTPGLVILNTSTGLIDLSATPLGTYTVTYTTNGTCPNTSTFNITITNAPSADFTYAGPYCQASSNPSPVFGAGASAGTFTSTPVGLVFVSNLTGEIDLLASMAGTYLVTNTIAASGGCSSATDTSSVTIDQSATVTASADASICASNTYILSGAFGGSATSSTWFTSGTGTFDNIGLPAATYTPSAADILAGSVTLTILTNDPSGSCSAEVDDMILTISPQDDATFDYGGSTFCQTGSNPVATTVSPGVFSSTPAGLVFVSSTTGEINLIGTTLGTYTITYISSGTCPDTTSSSVTITLSPSATFSYSGPYCLGTTNPLPTFISPASAGVFSSTVGLVFIDVNTGEIDLVNSTAGTYTVTNTIAASGGCSMATDSSIVTINPVPNADAGAVQILTCTSTTVILNGSSSSAGATFSWAGVGVLSGGSTSTPTVNSVGTFTVTVTDPANSCTSTDTVSVFNNTTPPNANAGSSQTLTCIATTVILNGASTTTGGTFSWAGAGIVSGGTTATPAVNAAGTYTLTVTDPTNGCTSFATVAVTSNTTAPNANAGAGQALTCTTASAVLNGSSTTIGSTFSWAGAGIVLGGTTATPTVNAGGTYTLTVTDPANGCTSTSTVVVASNTTPPIANAGPIQVIGCDSSTTTIVGAGSSSGAGIGYNWTGGTIVSGGSSTSPIVNAGGIYTLTVTDSTNGCSSTDTVSVISSPTPVASFTASPITGAPPLPVDFTNSSTNSNTYFWDFGNGNTSTGTNPSDIYNTPGTYNVILIASDAGNCPDTTQFTIIVYDNFTIIIPNVFSPNGDGSNDIFFITSTGVAAFKGGIYDRWGLKLVELDNIVIGWDGRTSAGAIVSDGTYYYIFTVTAQDGSVHDYKGFISLVR